jgi:hypothetical protein
VPRTACVAILPSCPPQPAILRKQLSGAAALAQRILAQWAGMYVRYCAACADGCCVCTACVMKVIWPSMRQSRVCTCVSLPCA